MSASNLPPAHNHPTIICLTPIKNEYWILERFLKCASLWADQIIVADQNSTDQSREIAAAFPKVTLIDNPLEGYHESERQKLLLAAARQIPGPRLLIALDADEFLTANFMTSPEWQTVLQSPPGTVIRFQWANVLPDFRSYWPSPRDFAWGFMDDGSEHSGKVIHSPRVPVPPQAPALKLRDIKVLHYQYTDWERMKSKQRWYQCWERINATHRSPIQIYRQYHHMDAVPQENIRDLPEAWLRGYQQQGIDMTSIRREPLLWWDRDILNWLEKYGPKMFQRLDIWDVNWTELARQVQGVDFQAEAYADPRSWLDRWILQWLHTSQEHRFQVQVQLIEKLLRLVGW